MANNPYVNKVDLADGTVLIDLTSDTVAAGKMLSGTTAHDASGAAITGTMFGIGSIWCTDQNVTPQSVLGFGTWEKIRESQFTYGEAARYTHEQLSHDTYGHRRYRKIVYVWHRIG